MSHSAAASGDDTKSPAPPDTQDEFGCIPGFIRPNGFDLSVLTDAQLGDFLSALCAYCYDCVEIEHIQYQGKTYYNRTSSWYRRPEGVGELYDPDHNCKKTSFHPCEARPVALSKDVTFVMMWSGECSDDRLLEDHPKCWNSIVNTVQKCGGPDHVMLITPHSMLLHNESGANDDHRGSDHLCVEVEFTPRSILPPNSSVMSFSQVCHRIKSHRFDYWYELGGICSDNVKTTGDIIDVEFRFDHGS